MKNQRITRGVKDCAAIFIGVIIKGKCNLKWEEGAVMELWGLLVAPAGAVHCPLI